MSDGKRQLSFFIDCIPPKTTAQANMRIMKRKDGTQFVGKFASSKGKKVQDELLILLGQHKPDTPFDGAIRLEVTWRFPWRKSEPKKNRVNGAMWCDKRPDCSNLIKMFEDCMTRMGFWHDDSQIAVLLFRKMWADKPGISVTISDI